MDSMEAVKIISESKGEGPACTGAICHLIKSDPLLQGLVSSYILLYLSSCSTGIASVFLDEALELSDKMLRIVESHRSISGT